MKDGSLESITFRQIRVLCELLGTTNTRTLEFLGTRFSEYATDFTDVLAFFESMHLLLKDDSSVVLTPVFGTFLTALLNVKDRDPLIKEFVVDNLINSGTPSSAEVRSFVNEFHFDLDAWRFIPSNAQRLRYSTIRNLLMELDVVEIEQATGGYVVSDTRFVAYKAKGYKSRLKRVDWSRVNQQRELLGREAELAIIEIERDRLKQSPIATSSIEHVAEVDFMAGFDILSFEDQLDEFGQSIPRYIEVKAVSALDYRFHWSRNEIDVAKRLKDKYMLYLLPVKSPGRFHTDLLRIIRDPNSCLFNKGEWDWWEDSITFSLTRDARETNG
jgi:hypothetical protein